MIRKKSTFAPSMSGIYPADSASEDAAETTSSADGEEKAVEGEPSDAASTDGSDDDNSSKIQ